MATIMEDITAKIGMIEVDPKNGAATEAKITTKEKEEKMGIENESKTSNVLPHEELKEEKGAAEKATEHEEVATEVESKTGVSFPVKLDGKKLNTFGVRKKSMLGLGLKIYGFGIYTDNEKLKDLLKSKIGKVPAKPSKEMYQVAIDSDFEMIVRLVIVFSSLTMSMVRKSFDEGLGASIKKISGGKKDLELTKKILGEVSDEIKLTTGSVIEISRRPGYTLQTKVKDEVVSTIQSELICRAYINMYLGDDVFDKDAKEKFGMSMLSLM